VHVSSRIELVVPLTGYAKGRSSAGRHSRCQGWSQKGRNLGDYCGICCVGTNRLCTQSIFYRGIEICQRDRDGRYPCFYNDASCASFPEGIGRTEYWARRWGLRCWGNYRTFQLDCSQRTRRLEPFRPEPLAIPRRRPTCKFCLGFSDRSNYRPPESRPGRSRLRGSKEPFHL
jgi:hypothetical protein